DLHLMKGELVHRADELAKANEELQKAALARERGDKEIRLAYKQLETFSYTMAHDLRAPLRAMTGFSQILRDEYSGKPFDQAGRQYALRIEKGAREMDGLIEELLSYCHVAQAKLELVPLDPGSIVQDILSRKSAEFRESIDLSVGNGFPRVIGDRALLDQAIANLFSNAVKFATPGTRPVVRIRHDDHEKMVRLWIEDNGIGIDPEHHERIFRTF